MSRRALPPLNALRAFEAYARHGRLVAAADELCVTHGAVSRQIKRLEQDLGVRLLDGRSGARALTAEGARFAGALHRIFDDLEHAAPSPPAGPARRLELLCPGTFSMKWLLPRLAAFAARCPQVRLDMVDSSGPWRPSPGGPHAAIRIAGNEGAAAADVDAFAFLPRFFGPALTPALAAGVGADAAALLRLPRLNVRSLPRDWATWAAAAGRKLPAAVSEQGFDRSFHMLEAALGGLGVGLCDWATILPELQAGRLVAPLGFARSPGPYVLLRARGSRDEGVDALQAWLAEEGSRMAGPA